jgi:hypothetical protein
MLKRFVFLLVPLVFCSCSTDPWKNVPDFEVSNFECPVPGGKFLDDGNFVSSWSVLGPLDPGKAPSIHTEYTYDEALLNGNRTAPRGARWYRAGTGGENATEAGQVNFSSRFDKNPKALKRSVFYACATLKCSKEYNGLVLHVLGCGQLKVWVNGTIVYSCEKGSPGMNAEPAKVGSMILAKGCNRIVVKYLDDGKDFLKRRVFSLRFTDSAGNLSLVR